jgi:hypothetical protein
MPDPQKLPKLSIDPASEPLEVLKMVGTYQRYLEAIEEHAVAAARAAGKTWEDIAAALGVRRQSAWKRLSGVVVGSLAPYPEQAVEQPLRVRFRPRKPGKE